MSDQRDDRTPGAPDQDGEPTQPLSFGGGASPDVPPAPAGPDAHTAPGLPGAHRADAGRPLDPVWAPPGGPMPQAGGRSWHDYGRAYTTYLPAGAVPAGGPPPQRGSRGVLPAVGALALVIGLAGGVVGSAAYDRWNDDGSGGGTYAGGLNDVDTVELPPVEVDGGIAEVADTLLPSTVSISADLDGQRGGATGSGFVLDKQGHIITNNHVVESAAEGEGLIEVVDHEGNRHEVTLVGRSPVYDLAVLQLPEDVDLEPAALGSSEQLRVGDGVVAIGSPLGLSSTVTSGIVSALQRPVTTGSPGDDSSYINAVQTDAAINPGNSGGPLVNLRGQVVGVNSAIATTGGGSFDTSSGNIGVGFAIPVEQVRITADQILKTGEARYPVIGAEVRTGGQEPSDGAEIAKVLDGTPAADAGLQAGDLVTEINGQRVTDGISLIVNIRTHQPGETVELTVRRGGDTITAEVELGAEIG